MTLHAGDRVVRGACPHDCPDTCAFIYDVKNGKLVDVTGDPDHPMTRGGLCVKLNGFAEHHYNPERLLYPMRRTGSKGSGAFERISWDDALAEIKSRWTDIIATYGSQAIMPHVYLGHQGTLNGLTAGDAFFNRLGSTVAEKTYCESGSSTAWIMTVGPSGGLDLESLAYAKYIIVWGMNMISTNLHAWPFILDAQKKGAKIVVIDPVRTRTAKQADWHVAIKPGTDGALALGMMNVIIAEGLVDYDYVEKYTLGFDELKSRAANYPPERVAEITGIPAADIQKLAREYATTQPAAIRQGVAIERSRGGGQAIRAITCLPALVGAWRHVGGGTAEMPIRTSSSRARASSTSSSSDPRSTARWHSTRRSSPCLCTIPTRCRRPRRRPKSFRGCSAKTCSRSSASCSLPIRRATRTFYCRQRCRASSTTSW
jgi:anaerobic selenocysteine-containing dehydrogenase